MGISKILHILVSGVRTHRDTPRLSHSHTNTHAFPDFLATHTGYTRSVLTTISILLGLVQTQVASLPRMKGPALLALLPDIPGHCSLLALPDVSPAPLSDERRLDILELYKGIYQISTRDKDSQVKGLSAYMWQQGHKKNSIRIL